AGADPAQIPADAAGVGVVDALLGEPVDAGDPFQAPVHGGAGELPLNRLLLRLLHKGAHKVVDGGGGAVDIAEELGFHIPPAVDQLGAEIVVDIVAGGERQGAGVGPGLAHHVGGAVIVDVEAATRGRRRGTLGADVVEQVGDIHFRLFVAHVEGQVVAG